MWWTWVALLIALLLIALWFTPIRLHISFHQNALQADLLVEIMTPLYKFSRATNISSKVQLAFDHMLTRWFATGEPVKVPVQKTIRRLPHKGLLRVLGKPVRYLGRRSHCQRMVIHGEVGGSDAMESALLAGASWTVVGTVLGLFSRFVPMTPAEPVVSIRPNFRVPAWRFSADCILRFRLGHAMVAGVWILRRVLREKEIIAWARDSWRRKGVKSGDQRASNSGADEDRHGEP